ncbi:MAG TPA: hypothetical protein PKD53_04760 [Chloroflexaceae bacterium]|nr:hypothetical protein [Chloroflexaceae bacterium]
MTTGIICTITPELLQRLAAGEQVHRAIWMEDGTAARVYLWVDGHRPMVQVGPCWVAAEFAEQVRAALIAAGCLAPDESSDALL